jgi:hypothetical protein
VPRPKPEKKVSTALKSEMIKMSIPVIMIQR